MLISPDTLRWAGDFYWHLQQIPRCTAQLRGTCWGPGGMVPAQMALVECASTSVIAQDA